MDTIKLLGSRTTDAMKWAETFVDCKIKNNWELKDINEGLMVGWFANAMAAQEYMDKKRCPLYTDYKKSCIAFKKRQKELNL